MGKLLYINEDRQKPFGGQLVTLDDLEKFRVKLMMDIKLLLEPNMNRPTKRWLKSHEVKKCLIFQEGLFRRFATIGKYPTPKSAALFTMMQPK